MSNPWADSFDEYRQSIIGEGKGKKEPRWQDDDCDGKWYEKSDTDGKISKREKKEKEKHYTKETITLTRGDYGSRNVVGSAWHTAAKNKFKGYTPGGGLTSQFKLADDVQIDHIDGSKTEIVDVVKAPAMVAAPKLSNWKEEMQWQTDEALKPDKLKIKEGGVKNKVEINPEVKTEGYGATKRKEVKKALKRDRPSLSSKQRKKIASKVVKRKGDTSKSDDRYAYETVNLPKINTNVKMVKGIRTGVLPLDQTKIKNTKSLPQANSYEPEGEMIEEKKNLSNVSPLIDRVSKWSKTMRKEERVKFLKTGNVKDMSRGTGEKIIHGKTGVDYRLMTQNNTKKTVSASHEVEGEVLTEGPSDKSDARTKRDWKGPGAPGLDAHRERIRKHKERRGKKKIKEGLGAALVGGALATGLAIKGIQTANKIRQDAKKGEGVGGTINKRNQRLQQMMNQSYEPDGDQIAELNRYEKEKGKSTGSASYRSGVNTPRKGTPTKKGGSKDKLVHFGKGLVRKAEGRPTGQTRRSYDKRGKETDRKEKPERTVTKRREAAARAKAAMQDTRGT